MKYTSTTSEAFVEAMREMEKRTMENMKSDKTEFINMLSHTVKYRDESWKAIQSFMYIYVLIELVKFFT